MNPHLRRLTIALSLISFVTYKKMRAYMEKTMSNPTVGFRFDTDPEKSAFMCQQLNVAIEDLEAANDVMDLIQTESERGMTLLAASLFDVQLEKLAKILVQFGNSQLRNDITGFPGSLSGFSSRIKLLYAMGIIDKNTYVSLEVIRKLRNTCAHEPKDFNFALEKVWADISSIPLAIRFYDEDPEKNPEALPSAKHSRKTQFQMAVLTIFLNLLAAKKRAGSIAAAARVGR